MMTHNRQISWILAGLVFALVQPVAARIVYVDDDAAGENDGTSWVNAYNDLQSALAIAGYSNEIWVAEGIYVPSHGQERHKTFKLEEGAAIYGGFRGNEESRSERDWSLFESVLSGDIGVVGDHSDNCYHVVVGSDDALLDGFTICAGSATEARGNDQRGAGMLNDGVSPVVANCVFRDNQADMGGGGMYNDWEACPAVINCVFVNNSGSHDGGGISNNIRSCPLVQNCLFVGNDGGSVGGAVWNNQWSDAVFVNCTFAYNSATLSGGIHNNYHDEPTVKNCIFWGNSGYEIYHDGDNMEIGWCDIQAGLAGIGGHGAVQDLGGNIDQAPCFVDAAGGDYRLLPESPCIDAAIDAGVYADIEGNVRPSDYPGVDNNGDLPDFDMGAYEAIMPRLEVAMKFTPRALNCNSKGRWVKAHFVPPAEFTVGDVDSNNPCEVEPFGIESDHLNVSINDDGLVEIEAAFSRADFCGVLTDYGAIEVTVVGLLRSGQQFYGTDTIRIMDYGFEHLLVLSFYWLEADCAEPDWCGEADVDQNSKVDFSDYAITALQWPRD